jgi:NitT/TauT family transport system substrate-binding protein
MNRTLGIAAPFALAGIMAAGASSAADDVTFVLNWTTTGEHAPVFYAQSQGWYEDADLNVTIEQGQGSGSAAQRVGAGAVDMGIADLGTSMVARGAGADLVAVMNIYANSPYQFYWLASSGITGLGDFEGRRFGNPPGDAARAMWPALAGANDIPADSIAWVNIAPSAKVSALASGAIDGTTFFANYHHVMESAFGEDLRWFAWSDMGVNPYGNSVIANGAFLEENRDTVARMVAVLQRAHRYCAENGEECVAVLPEFSSGVNPDLEINNWNVTIDLMTDEVSTTQGLGYFDPARIAADYELVNRYFDIREPFDPASIFTNEFIDTSITMIAPSAD